MNKLDETENSYLQVARARYNLAGQAMQAAQEDLAKAEQIFFGFCEFLKVKYNLADGTQITPDGEIAGTAEILQK